MQFTSRARLLSSAALGLGLTMIAASPASADSVCALGFVPPDVSAVCTDGNGNGTYTEVVGGGTTAGINTPSATALIPGFGDFDSATTTGYIESTTAGRGVIAITDTRALTYTGTGSTLVGQAGATNATILNIIAPDVTFNSGTINALGTGSTALSVTANGGAGSGGINGTIDGNVTSAGTGIVLATTNSAGDGSVTLTSNLGTTIQATGGDAIDVTTAGSGPITLNLNGIVIGDTNIISNGAISSGAAIGIDVNVNNAASTTDTSITVGSGGIVSTNHGVFVVNNGTGGVTMTSNGSIDSNGGAGIVIFSTNSAGIGNISVTTAAGTQIGATANDGIFTQNSGSGNTTITNGASIVTGGGGANVLPIGIRAISDATGTGNVSVTNTGAIGTAGDRMQFEGIEATIQNAASAGTVQVTGTGAIFSAGSGVNAFTAGGGAVTVNYTGAIDATGGTGLSATSTSGLITVTSGAITTTAGDAIATSSTTGNQIINSNGVINANAGGISGNSTSGNITANVNANITSGANGVTLSSSGAKIVNVAAGATIDSTGLNDITFNGAGTGTVNNSGTIGADNTGTAVATGTSTVAITNNTGGIINGVVTLAGGADTFSNTGTWNTGGASDFGAGVDVLTNNAGGIINAATGASIANLETLTNAGTINAAGTLTFSGVATVLTNSGTFNLAAGSAVSGLGAVTNSGTTNAGAGSSLSSGAFTNSGTLNTLGAFTLTSTGAFANTGTLNLAPALFTLSSTGFTNSGTINATGGATTITANQTLTNSGTINLADGATGDVLTITNGFTGTGASLLRIDANATTADRLVIGGAVGGATGVSVSGITSIITTPILVVDTNGAASTAFTLNNTVVSPLIDLTLAQVGQDFFLTAVPNISAIEPEVIGDMAPNLWYQSADIYSNYAALRRTDLGVNRTSNIGFWGEAYYSRDKGDDQDVSAFGLDFTVGRVTTKRFGFQAGVDYLIGNSFVLGVTGGWEDAKADVRNSASEFKATGWNAGGYGIFGGASGFYGDVLVKYDQAKLRFESPAFAGVTGSPKIKSWGALGEAGYRFGSNGMNFDLGAGLGYVRSKIDNFSTGGIDFDFATVKSLRGDLSARVNFGTGPFTPFIEAKLFHEFEKHRNLRLVSGTAVDTIEGEGRGTWGRIEAGLGGQNSSGPILAAWADVGNVKGLGVKAGWRFGGSPVEAAPPPPLPPPPPPPPPPPATQTCPDGSVILATDACPAPPPPPPPPAPAPERG